eukprot:GHVP01032318.1.p1 GENE.GHVP01032318.1~~GHVP01032318.1.p1  ORF type:complete len:282 (-),score=34.66 GHVP01032318.1:548-1321(-)
MTEAETETQCDWSNSTACMDIILRKSFTETKTEKAHYLWLSGNDIPVKPFGYILEYFESNDGRNDICISDPNFYLEPQTIHHQWAILNKETAELLLSEKTVPYWPYCEVAEDGFYYFPDNICIVIAITNTMGKKWLFANNKQGIQPPDKRAYEHCTTYVSWNAKNAVGDISYPLEKAPFEYATLWPEEFDREVWNNPHTLFFRKVLRETWVYVESNFRYETSFRSKIKYKMLVFRFIRDSFSGTFLKFSCRVGFSNC